MNKWIYVGYAAAWLATSIAVCTGTFCNKIIGCIMGNVNTSDDFYR